MLNLGYLQDNLLIFSLLVHHCRVDPELHVSKNDRFISLEILYRISAIHNSSSVLI